MKDIKEKILIVDDSETNREMLSFILNDEHYQVIEASDGPEALILAKEKRPDLIITDLLMPEMDGYELVHNLKQDEVLSQIKVILYSSLYQEQEATGIAKSFGVKHFLKKPASKDEIIETVQKALKDNSNGIININQMREEFEKINAEHHHFLNKKLIQKTSDLEKLNSELENKIKERTLQLEKINTELQEVSIRDPLTGLYNRRLLDDLLKQEIARSIRKNSSFAVAILDIDFFKKINDQYGHNMGDVVLIQMAELIKNSLRKEDVVCRYGGEEFLLVLLDVSPEDALRRLEDLRIACSKMKFKVNEKTIDPITISIGVSLFPDHYITRDALIEASDKALYHAKNGGRNLVVIFQTQKGDKK